MWSQQNRRCQGLGTTYINAGMVTTVPQLQVLKSIAQWTTPRSINEEPNRPGDLGFAPRKLQRSKRASNQLMDD